jgi:SAM-dependent methyltransferase
MMRLVKSVRAALRRLGERRARRFDGALLPPAHMRYCGAEFRDDATFLASGKAEARRLMSEFGLDRHTRMLEIGCGPGRLPIGILAEFGDIDRYDGVDVDARAIRWCRTFITAGHPGFVFHHVAARNARYNPDGPPMDARFRLPLPDGGYDLVYLHSVFSNMEPDDVRVYAREFHRLLKPDGRGFLTAFVEENVPPVTVNPTDYLIRISGPLHVARYEKGYFLGLLESEGLAVEHFGHRADLGGQSVVHLRRPVDNSAVNTLSQ